MSKGKNSEYKNKAADAAQTTTPVTHIYVLLDRSGSMEAIRSDVVGGFNAFVAEQKAGGDDARLTLVQFDTADPAEVVLDDCPIADVPDLTIGTYVPRGGTPLLDATAQLIKVAKQRTREHRAAGEDPSVVFVTITDGQENSSHRFTLEKVREMIERRTAKGWTFVYLSASPDAYADAACLGYDQDRVQEWAPSPIGMAAAFRSTSAALNRRRAYLRVGAQVDARTFFDGDKEAERLRNSPDESASAPSKA